MRETRRTVADPAGRERLRTKKSPSVFGATVMPWIQNDLSLKQYTNNTIKRLLSDMKQIMYPLV